MRQMRATSHPIMASPELWDEDLGNNWDAPVVFGRARLTSELERQASMKSEAEVFKPRNLDKMKRDLSFSLRNDEVAVLLRTGKWPESRAPEYRAEAIQVHCNPFSALEVA